MDANHRKNNKARVYEGRRWISKYLRKASGAQNHPRFIFFSLACLNFFLRDIRENYLERFFFFFSSDNVNTTSNGSRARMETKNKKKKANSRSRSDACGWLIHPLLWCIMKVLNTHLPPPMLLGNRQLHIIKECQMCRTQFSAAARQKALRRAPFEETYFIGDRTKLRGFLPLPYEALFHSKNASAIVSPKTKKKATSKWNFLCSEETRMYYDLTMRRRNV